ncbi:MAG: hypothetical protein ACFB10_05970 [Salibacteraceae bacterium]
MPKGEPITLQQLSTHLLNEVIRADAQMQLNQRQTWKELIDMNTQLVDSIGMGPAPFLGVDEMRFDLSLTPAKPSRWQRFKARLGIGADPYQALKNHFVLHRSTATEQAIAVSIVVKRDNQGRWKAAQESSAEADLIPEESHVIGISG